MPIPSNILNPGCVSGSMNWMQPVDSSSLQPQPTIYEDTLCYCVILSLVDNVSLPRLLFLFYTVYCWWELAFHSAWCLSLSLSPLRHWIRTQLGLPSALSNCLSPLPLDLTFLPILSTTDPLPPPLWQGAEGKADSLSQLWFRLETFSISPLLLHISRLLFYLFSSLINVLIV